MNVVMLVKNSFEYDARVTKEARSLIAAGHTVHVVAILVPDVTPEHEVRDDGIEVHRVSRVNFGVDKLNKLAGKAASATEGRRSRLTGDPVDADRIEDLGNLGVDTTATPGASQRPTPTATAAADRGPAEPPSPLRRAWGRASSAVLRWAMTVGGFAFRVVKAVMGRQGQGLKHYAINRRFISRAVSLQPDVVHCHDLNTLWAGRKVKAATGCKLVYDSHEMATARNRMGLGWRLWCEHFEKAGVPDADAVIMASPGYADVARERYGVESTVVINVPPPQEPTGQRDLRTETGVNPDHTFLIYQGSIQENRGIEQVIDAVELLNQRIDADDDGVSLVVVGYGYHRPTLERMVRDRGLADVVKFYGPVPNRELVDWSSSADIGMCNIVGISPSYRESLPNKFFEYVMAGIPVVVSDFGSMGRICEEEGVGVTCDPTDAEALAAAVVRLRGRETYERCRRNALTMATKYNWTVEQRKLVAVYEELSAP